VVCTGTGVLNHYGNPSCAGNPTASDAVGFSSSCGEGGSEVDQGNGFTLTNVTFGPSGSCSSTPQATSQPAPLEQQISVCQPDTPCGGGACLTAAEQSSLCVSHPGAVPCPPGFLTSNSVAAGAIDTRGCGACSCGATLTCTLTGLLVDNDPACGTGNPYNFTAIPGKCTVAPSSYPFNAAEAIDTVAGSGACATISPSSPTGTVTLDPSTTSTVCCP
jgi:hypothetical protein